MYLTANKTEVRGTHVEKVLALFVDLHAAEANRKVLDKTRGETAREVKEGMEAVKQEVVHT